MVASISEVFQMAMQSMPFAHRSFNWGTAAVGLGAASAAALFLTGQGQAAFAFLACLGAAASVLFAAGQLQFKRSPSRIDEDARRIFSALPGAVAITDKKGIVHWRSEAFLHTTGCLGLEHDLS